MNVKNPSNNSSFPNFLPSFGCTASFSSVNESITFADNFKQVLPKGINSLTMKLNLNFNQLTNIQSRELISFFENQFKYKPQSTTNDSQGRPTFDSKRLDAFLYSPFYPYKANHFNCLRYSVNVNRFNVNDVSAELISINNTILDSIEPNVFTTQSRQLMSEYELICTEIIPSDISSLHGSSTEIIPSDISSLHGHHSNSTEDKNHVFSLKNQSTDDEKLSISLQEGNYLYEKDTYRSFKLNESLTIGNNSTEQASIQSTSEHPSQHSYNNGLTENNQHRHSIFIDNPNECSFYPYAPRVGDEHLDCKMFDFYPSYSTNIEFSPKYKNANLQEISQRYVKYGFNPNLCNLNLSFNNRSNIEAKRILLFLENHLGYKKFAFHVHSDYVSNNNNTNYNLNNKNKILYFYCPEWTHTFNYYNNHNINATFIECLS